MSNAYAAGNESSTPESHELKASMSNGAPLGRSETVGSVSLTAEQFERLYLGPQNSVKGDLRKTFGNPTPVGLGGFVLALTPLVIQFMGWRGTGTANGLPTFGTYIFLGGMLAILASIGEFILGNTFPSIFFGTYGAFFMVYGVTLIPYLGAVTTFADPTAITPTMNAVEAQQAAYLSGAMSVQFNASVGFLSTFMALLTFIHLVASIRTNAFFVIAFLSLLLTFIFYAVSRFYGAEGDLVNFEYYQVVAGGCGFVTCMAGWYLFFAEVLASVDFPIALPVFDLSKLVPGASDRMKAKQNANKYE